METDRLKNSIGNHFVFRLNKVLMSGCFCGIGEIDETYGMVFINVKAAGVEMTENIALVVAPSAIKCTLYSDMLWLRSTCRKIFRNLKLKALTQEKIYYPTFQIQEVT